MGSNRPVVAQIGWFCKIETRPWKILVDVLSSNAKHTKAKGLFRFHSVARSSWTGNLRSAICQESSLLQPYCGSKVTLKVTPLGPLACVAQPQSSFLVCSARPPALFHFRLSLLLGARPPRGNWTVFVFRGEARCSCCCLRSCAWHEVVALLDRSSIHPPIYRGAYVYMGVL